MEINLNNIDKTIKMLQNVLQLDNINNVDMYNITHIIKVSLQSQKFFDSIKNDIDNIMADGKITSKDLPRILVLLLKSNTFFLSLRKLNPTVLFESIPYNLILKYSSLSLFYYLMLNDNVEQNEIDSFLLLYPSLWNLIELSLPQNNKEQISNKVSTKCC